MILENLKQYQLNKEELKSIKGSKSSIYCITLHKGICEKKSFCSESAELTSSWAYAWEGFGWSTQSSSNCQQT